MLLSGGHRNLLRCHGEEKGEGKTERQTRTSKTRLHQSVALIRILSILTSDQIRKNVSKRQCAHLQP